jgi:hypothetical protein
MMTSLNGKEELFKLLEEAIRYYEGGLNIWSSVVIHYPQSIKEAVKLALANYHQAVELLESIATLSPPDTLHRMISGYRDAALAAAASVEAFLYDEWDDDQLETIVQLVNKGIRHKEQAVQHFSQLSEIEGSFTLGLEREILFEQARSTYLSARLAGRRSDLKEALSLYRLSCETYYQLMVLYESETPELKAIKEEAIKNLDRQREILWERNEEKLAVGIRWTAITFRFSSEPTGSPYEDIYRRAASNYFTANALIANLEGYEALSNGVNLQEIDSQLEKSIYSIYLAMEMFPDNLETHQDLLNNWRIRGELLGCPLKDGNEYYHAKCPLAIMHYIGAWYVSPTLEYDRLDCTVCGQDALQCPHYPGEIVEGQIVRYKRHSPIISSVSFVDIPEDPSCRVEWISIPKKYFTTSPATPRLQCRFCHPENFQGELKPLLINLPDAILAQVEKQYQQIIKSKRYRHIKLSK